MNIVEENEKAIQKIKGNFYQRYIALKEKACTHTELVKAGNGEVILVQMREDRAWRLNSAFDPDAAAEMYAGKYKEIKDYAPLCIFGISDGKAIRALIKRCNGTQKLLIYEPDFENFCTAMQHFSLADILEYAELQLVVGQVNAGELQEKIDDVINYQNRMLVQNCILPNYDLLYPKEGQDFIEKMLYCSKKEIFNKNTEVKYGKKLADNVLYNYPHILKGCSIKDLERKIKSAGVADVPAIIVSAGPSLDKNIRTLKQAEGKAFIIGVDSALKALVREQIQFQVAVSVDPRKHLTVFEDERLSDIPYVLSCYSIPEIAERNHNKIFYASSPGFDSFEELIKTRTGSDLGELKTGGSVATDAFWLALKMGFRQIILIGQDLGFTGGRGHVSGFEASEEENKKHLEHRSLVEVEANGGGKILTDVQMESYRKWFELRIAEQQGKITVYNATEGGARIHGTVEITLQDAIEKMCRREVDFDEMICQVAPMLTLEQQKECYGEVMELPEKLARLAEELQNGIRTYQRLIELEKLPQKDKAEYQEVIDQITKVNEIEEQNKLMNFIKYYAKNAEYEAAEDIYTAEELSVEEIAERGIRLLSGYVEGIKEAKEHMEQILIPQMKKKLSN